MHSHRRFRSLSVVLVLALFVAPWAAEARPAAAPRADTAASPAILDHFIGWLVALWGDVDCTMGPNGGECRESLDTACGWDPNGGCRESLDNGCGWDPNGGGCRGDE